MINWIIILGESQGFSEASHTLAHVGDDWQVTIVKILPATSQILNSNSIQMAQVAKLIQFYQPYERKPLVIFADVPGADISIDLDTGKSNMSVDQWKPLLFEDLEEARLKNNLNRRKVVVACVASPPFMAYSQDPATGMYRLTNGKEVQLIHALANSLNFRLD